MLTRIEIDGFKTFEKFAIDLEPFVVILGVNAAGKSNLFDAVQLLSNLATQDVSQALKNMRGEPAELFRRTQSGLSQHIRFAVEVLIDPKVRDPWGKEVSISHTRLRYELELERREVRPGVEKVMVSYESLRRIASKADTWAKRFSVSKDFRKQHLKYSASRNADLLSTSEVDGKRVFRLHQDGHSGRTQERPATAAEATVLYSITNTDFPHLFAMRDEMHHWRLLQLDPALLRRPSPATSPDLLTADGSNLAAVLARLKAETSTEDQPQGVLHDIALALNNLIPGVRSLDAGLDPGTREYRIHLTMRDGLPFSSRVISDGTLRVLALLTLLHDPRHRGMVCFEEPENGVHPARLKRLMERLRDMVSTLDNTTPVSAHLNQLLLNSHSPVVLSSFLTSTHQTARDPVLFADTAQVVDAQTREIRRKTRLRPVTRQDDLPNKLKTEDGMEDIPVVSSFEVESMLNSIRAEG